MQAAQQNKIDATIKELFKDSQYDALRMMKAVAKRIFGPLKPIHFKNAYLSITNEQGEELTRLIKEENIKNVVEFGTSFGISTLFLAAGTTQTNGQIITTELLESKAKTAIKNFEKAGVNHLIDTKVGDAMETLKGHSDPIDLLLLDGWKDLYLPLFQMLEPNFHSRTVIYVDNADMADTQLFLETVKRDSKYQLEFGYGNSVCFIRLRA